MKTRSILPFAVFGFLLALLLAVSACENDGFKSNAFGGPYKFALPDENAAEKMEDFIFLKAHELSLSKPTLLSESLLKESITANRWPNIVFPTADQQEQYDNVIDKQKYNYVIDLGGNIIVAEWGDNVELENVLSDDVCSRRDFTPQKPRRMINWFPEDSGDGQSEDSGDGQSEDSGDGQSPCWLKVDETRDTIPGLLDAISKHLMLAQGEENGVIEKFEWDAWKNTKVAYAGELIVDLVSCTYTLNNDSGTYGRPNRDELENVAKYFDDKLDVGPVSYVKFFGFDDDRRDSPEIRATENLSTRISNAPPVCP